MSKNKVKKFKGLESDYDALHSQKKAGKKNPNKNVEKSRDLKSYKNLNTTAFQDWNDEDE